MTSAFRWQWPIACILGLGLYYYVIGRSAPFNFADEGYLYYLGWAMAGGKLPFRDFQLSSYPPGLFAFYAVTFKIFGAGINSGRCLSVLWMVANACISYALTRKLAGRKLAFFAALIIGLVPGPWHKAYIGALCLSTLALAARLHADHSAKNYILLGCVIGIGLQLRLDAAIGTLSVLPVAIWKSATGSLLIRHLALLTLAMILTMMPLAIYLGVNDILKDYLEQVLGFANVAAERSTAWYRLPAPTVMSLFDGGPQIIFAWLYYSSLLIPLCLIVMTVKLCAHKHKCTDDFSRLKLTLLLAVWVLMSVPQYALERPDAGHLFQRGFVIVIGGCFLVGQNGLRATFNGPISAIISIPVVLVLLLYAGYGLNCESGGSIAYRSNSAKTVQLPNGMAFIEPLGSSLGKVALEILNNTRQTEFVAAIPYAPGINFLVKRHTPGRMVHYFPNAIRTTDEDFIAASQLARAQYIVLQPAFKLAPTKRAELGCYAPITAELINSEYRRIPGFEGSLLLLRKADGVETGRTIPSCEDESSIARK